MHKKIDVVRAWRDEEYRNSLTAEERAGLPENPAGMATVDDSILRSVTGGLTRFCTTPDVSCVPPGTNCP
jgi:mersacidin/lichenicidin family type 2 lantibiotic